MAILSKKRLTPGESPELFYVVSPPEESHDALSEAKRQLTHYVEERHLLSRGWRGVRAFVRAVGLIILWAIIGLIGFYGLYTAKSIMGIDLFPNKHLEDFVPIPGFHRWPADKAPQK